MAVDNPTSHNEVCTDEQALYVFYSHSQRVRMCSVLTGFKLQSIARGLYLPHNPRDT